MQPVSVVQKPVKTVAIANISEYYLPIFAQFQGAEREAWTEPGLGESDMSLFWAGDDKLVITPISLDEAFVTDTCRALGYRNVQLSAPTAPHESLCSAIASDPKLFLHLVQVMRQSASPQVISWGATKQFSQLVERLKDEHIQFHTPELPAGTGKWTVRYLDSKCGFRELCTSLATNRPNIRIPHGYTCGDIDLAAQIAATEQFQRTGVAIKVAAGVGGHGTLLIEPHRTVNVCAMAARLHMSAKLMPIFCQGPLIVEELVAVNADEYLRSPSIQGFIDPKGNVTILCTSLQILTHDGRYKGAMLGKGVVPDILRHRLTEIGNTIGQAASAIGYRGVFGIDTLLDKDGVIFCIELNARRTSVKYLVDIALHLYGPSFESKVAIISNERFESKRLARQDYASIREQLVGLLYPMNGKQCGILITIISSLTHYSRNPKLGFVAIGDSFAKAESIYAQASQLLS